MVINRKMLLLLMVLIILTVFFKTVYDLYGVEGLVILTGLTITAVSIAILRV